MNKIYKLLPMLDTPGYSCFYTEDNAPLESNTTLIGDFYSADVSTRAWKARALAGIWTPRRAINPLPGQTNDYPCIALHIPTFSERAVKALRDLLEPNGELLPLICDEGSYYAFNVTTVADVLNREVSEIKWQPLYRLRKVEPVLAEKILYYDFYPDRVVDLAIFRIPEGKTGYYVTERFAQRIRENDLHGFNLQLVWPLPRPKKPGGLQEMDRRAGV